MNALVLERRGRAGLADRFAFSRRAGQIGDRAIPARRNIPASGKISLTGPGACGSDAGRFWAVRSRSPGGAPVGPAPEIRRVDGTLGWECVPAESSMKPHFGGEDQSFQIKRDGRRDQAEER